MVPYHATHESTIGCSPPRTAPTPRLKPPANSSATPRARPPSSRAASFGNRIAPGLSDVGSLIGSSRFLAARGQHGAHQPNVPGSPLNGPVTRDVIQPP